MGGGRPSRTETVKQFVRPRLDAYFLPLVLLMVLGLGLRLFELGTAPFWVDEVLIARAADNFAAGKGFVEPTGRPYWRSWLTVTFPVAVLFKLFGTSEFVARLPSALVGTAIIPMSYFLGKELINRPAGLLLAAVMTVDPWALMWSQETRMYVHFQFFFMLTLYLFYRWYADDLDFMSPWLLGLLAVIPLGYVTHQGYLLVGLVFLIFLFLSTIFWVVVAIAPVDRDVDQAFVARHVLSLVGAVAAAAGMLVFKGLPPVVQGSTPAWYGGKESDIYWRTLKAFGPIPEDIAAIVVGVGLVYLLAKRSSGIFLIVAAAVPFLLQSFVIQWRIARYIYHLYPLYLLICIGPLAELLYWIQYGFTRAETGIKERLFSSRRERTPVVSYLVIFVAILVVVQMALPLGASITFLDETDHGTLGNRPDHRGPANYIANNSDGNVTIISSTPSLTHWYVGRVDYSVYPHQKTTTKNGTRVDIRTGEEVLMTAPEVERVMSEGSGYIIADHRLRWYANESVKQTIRENSVRVDDGQWKDVQLYYYGPDQEAKAN